MVQLRHRPPLPPPPAQRQPPAKTDPSLRLRNQSWARTFSPPRTPAQNRTQCRHYAGAWVRRSPARHFPCCGTAYCAGVNSPSLFIYLSTHALHRWWPEKLAASFLPSISCVCGIRARANRKRRLEEWARSNVNDRPVRPHARSRIASPGACRPSGAGPARAAQTDAASRQGVSSASGGREQPGTPNKGQARAESANAERAGAG